MTDDVGKLGPERTMALANCIEAFINDQVEDGFKNLCIESEYGVSMAEGRAIVSALRRAVDSRLPWQPIETAPNDGMSILVTGGKYKDYVFTAEADGDWWRRGKKEGLKSIPTHWMPMPAPPSVDE